MYIVVLCFSAITLGIIVEKIKIIQMGLGDVGRGVAQLLVRANWAEIVGVIDIDPSKVDKDLGDILGLATPLGIVVTDDANTLFSSTEADIVVASTTSGTLRSIYPEIIKPLQKGMNVITPCMDISDPYLYDPVITTKIQELSIENEVTFLGIGSTQLVTRCLLAIAETCREIKKVTCSVHADVTKFSLESKQQGFGILFTESDYENAVKSDALKGRQALRKEAILIANCLQLEYDETRSRYEPIINDNTVTGVSHIFEVLKNNHIIVEYNYKFIEDPEHKYFHEFVIDAIPSINTRIDFSLDRGIEGTIVPLANCIPYVIASSPGILSMLDLPPGLRLSY